VKKQFGVLIALMGVVLFWWVLQKDNPGQGADKQPSHITQREETLGHDPNQQNSSILNSDSPGKTTDAKSAGDGGIRVFGQVLIEDTKQPASNAWLTLSNGKLQLKLETRADRQGQFSFQVPATGTWRYTAETETYAFPLYPFDLQEPSPNYGQIQIDEGTLEIGPLTIYLEVARPITVSVVEKNGGQPIPNATVTALSHKNQEFQVDSHGKATLLLTPFLWSLSAVAPGHTEVKKTVDLSSNIQSLVFELDTGGTLFGRVADHNDEPFEGVFIFVQCNGANPFYGKTDARGNYLIRGLPLGKKLSIHCRTGSSSSYRGLSDGVTAAKPNLDHDITLSRLEHDRGDMVFWGEVVDGNNEPVSGVEVHPWGMSRFPAIDVQENLFKIQGLAQSAYRLAIEAPGFQTKYTSFKPVPEEDVGYETFVLEPGYRLAGSISDTNGNMLESQMYISGDNRPFTSEKSDKDGSFFLDDLPARVNIFVNYEGLSSFYEKDIELDKEDLHIILKEQAEIYGRVVGAGGDGVKNFRVKIQHDRFVPAMVKLPGGELWREISHEQGHFTIDRLNADESLLVYVEAEGYQSKVFESVSPGKGRQRFQLEPVEEWIEGVVIDTAGNVRPGVRVHIGYYNPSTFPQGRLSLFEVMKTSGRNLGLPEKVTDELGRFSFESPRPGFGFELLLHQGGIGMKLVKAAHLLLDGDDSLMVVVTQEAAIAGLCNWERYPKAEEVRLYRDKNVVMESMLDGDGNFNFSGLPPGPYSLTLREPVENGVGHLTRENLALELREGEQRQINLGFDDSFTLEGMAVMGDRPMAGGHLVLLGMDPIQVGQFFMMDQTFADGSGKFWFHKLSSGNYALAGFKSSGINDRGVRHPNRVFFTVDGGHLQQNFAFAPYSQITGSLGGELRLGAFLIPVQTATSLSPVTGSFANNRLNFNDVPPGNYHLIVKTAGNKDIMLVQNLLVNEGEDQDLGDLSPDKFGFIDLVPESGSDRDLGLVEVLIEGKGEGLPMARQLNLQNDSIIGRIPIGMVKVTASGNDGAHWSVGPVIVRVKPGAITKVGLAPRY